MSYILDALKKSDQQRQRGAAPTLLTVQTPTAAPERPKVLKSAGLVVVLLCVGIVVGWLRPWQLEKPVPVAEPLTMEPLTPGTHPAMPAPPRVPIRMAAKAEAVPVAQRSASEAQSFRLTEGAVMKQGMPTLADRAPRASLPQTAPVFPQEAAMPSTDKKDLASPADVGLGKRVMALNELPASVQQEIPGISISFHVYSTRPKDRRVMINGEMVGQGEQVAPGLSLEEITPDGVIFAYKGYRFRQGVR